jgi:hypothetical protein
MAFAAKMMAAANNRAARAKEKTDNKSGKSSSEPSRTSPIEGREEDQKSTKQRKSRVLVLQRLFSNSHQNMPKQEIRRNLIQSARYSD